MAVTMSESETEKKLNDLLRASKAVLSWARSETKSLDTWQALLDDLHTTIKKVCPVNMKDV